MKSGRNEENARAWVFETVGEFLGIQVDPAVAMREARSAESARAAGHALGIELAAAPVPLELTQLPLVTFGSIANQWAPAVIREAQGTRVLLHRPEGEPEWVTLESLEGLCPAAQWHIAWLMAPLETLTHHSPTGRLWQLAKQERSALGIIGVYAAGVGLFTLATPIAVQALVGSVAFGTALQPIVVLSILLTGALTFQSTLKALQAYVVETVQQRLFVRVALDLGYRLPRVTHAAIESGFGAESVNRFFEIVTLQKTTSIWLTDGVATVLQVTIGLVVLAFYHPFLLAFALALIAISAVVVIAPSKLGLSTSINESIAKYEVADWLQSVASAPQVFGSEAAAALVADRAESLTRSYLTNRRRHFRVLFGQTVATLGLQIVASAALLGLGGWLVLQKELTLGQLVAAELIVAAVVSGLSKTGKLLDAGYDLLTSVDKVGHLLDVPIHTSGSSTEAFSTTRPIRVEARNLTHGHQHLDLVVASGERVAVICDQPMKWAQSLAGQRPPDDGLMLFDGIEGTRLSVASLREHVSLIRGRAIFQGTVLENVSIGRPGAPMTRVRAALEQVGLLDAIRALPKGLDTRLEATGAPLTTGQVVQLQLARAIIAAPKLVVIAVSLEMLSAQARDRCIDAMVDPAAPWSLIALVENSSDALVARCNRTARPDSDLSHV